MADKTFEDMSIEELDAVIARKKAEAKAEADRAEAKAERERREREAFTSKVTEYRLENVEEFVGSASG